MLQHIANPAPAPVLAWASTAPAQRCARRNGGCARRVCGCASNKRRISNAPPWRTRVHVAAAVAEERHSLVMIAALLAPHLHQPPGQSMRPPSQILRALAEAQAKVFSTAPPPPPGQESLRTGAKYLRKRLVGPSMLRYYPPTLNLRSIVNRFESFKYLDPETGKEKSHLMHPREAQRLADVERKKKIGKGPPKKGECFLCGGRSSSADTALLSLSRRRKTGCHEEQGWEAQVARWPFHVLLLLSTASGLANLFHIGLECPTITKGILRFVPPVDADAQPLGFIAPLTDVVEPAVSRAKRRGSAAKLNRHASLWDRSPCRQIERLALVQFDD